MSHLVRKILKYLRTENGKKVNKVSGTFMCSCSRVTLTCDSGGGCELASASTGRRKIQLDWFPTLRSLVWTWARLNVIAIGSRSGGKPFVAPIKLFATGRVPTRRLFLKLVHVNRRPSKTLWTRLRQPRTHLHAIQLIQTSQREILR